MPKKSESGREVIGRRSVLDADGVEEGLLHVAVRAGLAVASQVAEEALEDASAAYDPGIGDLDDDVDNLFEVMDRDGGVFFADDVDEMIDSGRLSEFVNDVLATLEYRGDLWQLALLHARGDEAEAVRLMVVLYQDTKKNRAIVGRIDDLDLRARVSAALDRVGRAGRRLPPEVPDRGVIYHYYVIRLMAARLREKRDLEPDRAFAAPFMLNTEYELRALKGGERPKGGGFWAEVEAAYDQITTPLEDFGKIDAAAVRDIYLGYAGAWHGAQLGGTLIDFETFRARLLEDPYGFFRSLVGDAAAQGHTPPRS